jgi:hypothetical protein
MPDTPITLNPDGLAAMRAAFLAHCTDFVDFPTRSGIHHTEERLYKEELVQVFHEEITPALFEGLPDVEAARRVVEAARAVLTRRLPSDGKPQNLLGWRVFWFLKKMTDDETVAFAEALCDLLYGNGDSADRLERFDRIVYPTAKRLQKAVSAWTAHSPTLWLMLQNPADDIFIGKTKFQKAFELLVGHDPFTARLFDAAQYRYIQQVCHALFDALADWKPRDMIDVQGFIWTATADDDSQTTISTIEPATKSSRQGLSVSSSHFDRLLHALATTHLTFSPEVVSNYLLALQSKRFVLLTGISGTGKTQLAMAVAKHFRPVVDEVQSVDTPPDAIEITVWPTMIKGTMTLPVALTANLRLPPGEKVRVIYPRGFQDVAFWRSREKNVTQVFYGGDLGQWFQATFNVGDRALLSIERSEGDDQADQVRIAVPKQQTVRLPLDNYAVIAVQPDWTDRRGLLGFFNPITNRYVSTKFLELLLRASADVEAAKAENRAPYPFFAILDEMNLARVEHYFADFLSCLESGEPLDLHDDAATEAGEDAEGPAIPRKLAIPPNLFFTGTVNIDETTYMFSPKVLDRAFTIELNEVDLGALGGEAELSHTSPLRLNRLPPMPVQRTPPSAVDWKALGKLSEGELDLQARVQDIHDLLARTNRHFGYRVANEIARYVTLAAEQAGGSEDVLRAALDLALLQKVLPKFHGTQAELEDVLGELFVLALDPAAASQDSRGDLRQWQIDRGHLVPATTASGAGRSIPDPDLPRTAAKLWRMLDRLQRQGFTSFIE